VGAWQHRGDDAGKEDKEIDEPGTEMGQKGSENVRQP
jgi:hypothetical protein